MRNDLLLILAFLMISGCNCKREKAHMISGEAQGTTYHITYLAKAKTDLKSEVDSILRRIDSSLSTYLPVSIISKINNNLPGVLADEHFIKVFNKAIEVAERTDGLFDITVAPLINAWGFGFSEKEKVDSFMIQSLLQVIGYKMVRIQNNMVIKDKEDIMLDFNAIAQGYTVDVIAEFFDARGIQNYFVELGGEIRARGEKGSHEYWQIGIDKPVDATNGEREIMAILKMHNKSLATSGNYRRFYEEDGKRYSHIINPKTGFPAKSSLLSVSVVAGDCMTADAYSTAFMVMGLEKSFEFLNRNKALDLGVFFIYDDQGKYKTYTSEGLKKWMEILP